MPHITDDRLVQLLIEGNQQAFETIYRLYVSNLYKYARKNISVKEDCEEIVQEVFESLWVRRKELGHITILSAYLFKMVKYKVIRYFQHHAVKKKYADHYRLFEAMYESINDEEKDQLAIETLIEKNLTQLPERCQQVVKLRLHENLSNGDIAKRMNIKKSTVENYIVTAVSHLRASYHMYKAG